MNAQVVLVEPERQGNIGSVARIMKNFELSELWLVKPKSQPDREARRYASHAVDILERARIVDRLEAALEGTEIRVGSTSIEANSGSNLTRIAVTPSDLATIVSSSQDKIALIFGRESSGLRKSELELCDMVVSIQANPVYRTLNVAIAAGIIIYCIYQASSTIKQSPYQPASRAMKDMLNTRFASLCDQIDLPRHKIKLTAQAFHNIVGRSAITQREATLLLGMLRRAANFCVSEKAGGTEQVSLGCSERGVFKREPEVMAGMA